MTFLLISTLGSQYRFILSYDIARGGDRCGTGMMRRRTEVYGLFRQTLMIDEIVPKYTGDRCEAYIALRHHHSGYCRIEWPLPTFPCRSLGSRMPFTASLEAASARLTTAKTHF
jgi:hypothetical protein